MNRIWIAAVIVTLCTFAGVAQSDITVLDQTGQTMTVPQPVEKLASVYGIGTFYVYALGAADRLVTAYYVGVKGISSASEAMFRWEPRLADILSFGDPNVEELAASGAQVILADGARHAAFAEQMAYVGIPVVQYLVETPEELKEAMVLTGNFLGADAQARANVFIADYDRVFDTVARDLADLRDEERIRVLFLGTSLTTVASGDMFQSHLIAAAGGRSVASDLLGYWSEVNLEQILLWNPEVIVIPPYGPVQPADIIENPDWAAIDAVKAGRVHRMPRVIGPMDTPVPESLLGIVWMAKLFYPELVSLDLEEEVTRFYSFYYDFVLTDEEVEYLISP
ncbi:ABC transporter substrate-binding protein [Candidatus Bipolaricaulota bacterium]|nr:ABC transporter substrate-binding protein [Candidatus Bipolaricaulota bacterium]